MFSTVGISEGDEICRGMLKVSEVKGVWFGLGMETADWEDGAKGRCQLEGASLLRASGV